MGFCIWIDSTFEPHKFNAEKEKKDKCKEGNVGKRQ